VIIEKAQGRRKEGNPYRMQVDIRIPNHTGIVVKRESIGTKKIPDGLEEVQANLATEPGHEPLIAHPVRRSPVRKRGVREEPLESLITLTFGSARRQLKKVVDKRRGDVKIPAQEQNLAMVEKLFPDYGFLRTTDGQAVYFHRNSVLHNHWDKLAPGTSVRFSPEIGEKGLQASTVELVEKRGESETHGELHDLPEIVPAAKKKPASAGKK